MKLVVHSPLEGWAMPLTEVPDEVFAAAMAGEGVAIDPTGDTVCAPFDGEIVPVGTARHAVTVRSAGGVEVLVHVGIDTVALAGAGFDWLARPGERVAAGTPLLRFDLDAVARRAKSLATPIVLAGGGIIGARIANRRVGVGDTLFEVDVLKRGKAAKDESAMATARMRVPFDHGLHVRPAALVAAALKPFTCDVAPPRARHNPAMREASSAMNCEGSMSSASTMDCDGRSRAEAGAAPLSTRSN